MDEELGYSLVVTYCYSWSSEGIPHQDKRQMNDVFDEHVSSGKITYRNERYPFFGGFSVRFSFKSSKENIGGLVSDVILKCDMEKL